MVIIQNYFLQTVFISIEKTENGLKKETLG